MVLRFDKIIVHKIYEGKKEREKEGRNGPEENRKRRVETRKNDIYTGRKETRTRRMKYLL